jgi:rhodanese-related sulfurtransferase
MQNISAEEVKQKLDKGEPIHLIDVREPYEHDEFNIGGVLCPLRNIQTMMVDDIEYLRNEEVILYCRSGNRSGQACLILDMLGFTNTKNLLGGIVAWQDKFS